MWFHVKEQLVLYSREIIAVYCESHKCKNAEFINSTAGGIYIYHWTIIGEGRAVA
jgi:hypothetical protein